MTTPKEEKIEKTPQEKRAEEVKKNYLDHSHYCPGCGRVSNYPRECTGTKEAPHQPIEAVSTDELRGDDPAKYTPAPPSG